MYKLERERCMAEFYFGRCRRWRSRYLWGCTFRTSTVLPRGALFCFWRRLEDGEGEARTKRYGGASYQGSRSPGTKTRSGVTRLRYFHGVQELQGTWGLGDPWGGEERKAAALGEEGRNVGPGKRMDNQRWVRYNYCALRLNGAGSGRVPQPGK